MSGTISRRMAAEIAAKNDVTVLDVLAAIRVFKMCKHPDSYVQIELLDDGSGCITSRCPHSGEQKALTMFPNLRWLVAESERLMAAHGIEWVN